ncbi:DNA repair protein RadC [Limibacillus sp. MBR-115]|uniref:RadC family protein n=1 Tax=Limibacillus sp. MBR-115 TaxID=3156465 RepID=UPI003391668F
MAEKELREPPHYFGHRQRLRERFLLRGGSALSDYEVIELLLFGARPRGDVKPLAKDLLRRFGSLSALLSAPAEDLARLPGLGEASVVALKIVQEAALRLAREEIRQRPVLSSWNKVLNYARIMLAEEKVERFHLLFLDRKNRLISDEEQQRGTVDHTPVYPREVIKRALDLGASSIILIHNHPSGDPTPSKQDIAITREIVEAAGKLGIEVHDHLIIGKGGHTSLKSLGLF